MAPLGMVGEMQPYSEAWELSVLGRMIAEVRGIKPQLESWNRSDDPEQVRLRDYLREFSLQLGPLPEAEPLFLKMIVDIEKPERLQRHHDIENYLTPLVRHLGARRFRYVEGLKRVGGGSVVRVGSAVALRDAIGSPGWEHFSCAAGAGTQEKRWKEGLRSALDRAGAQPLPRGPVELRVAWRCSPQRNWVGLWKPTIDAMGPILGQADPRNPYNPNDDRIVRLCLHAFYDETIAHAVDVAIWWRLLGTAADPRRSELNTA